MEAIDLPSGRGITVDDLGLLKDKSYLTSATLQRVSQLPGAEEATNLFPSLVNRVVMRLHRTGQPVIGQVEGTQRCLILAWRGVLKAQQRLGRLQPIV